MAIVFLRTVIIFTLLLVFMRILGKRQLGELEISELVVSVLIADMACLPLQDIGIPLINALVSVVTLLCLELILSGVTLRSPRLRAAIWGRPCFLIRRGVIDQGEMRRNRFSLDELAEELRRQGVTDINSVQYAVLETNGTLSILLNPALRPVSAAQMNVPAEDAGYTSIIICEGRLLSDNLSRLGKDEAWLRQELSRRGFRSVREIYLLTLNDAGQVYCAGKEEP